MALVRSIQPSGREKLVEVDTNIYWEKEQFSIPIGDTVYSSSIPLTDFHSVDYVITAWNDSEIKTKSINMKVINLNTELKETVYLKTGNGINLIVTPIIDGSIMKVAISSSETYEINLDIARMVLG